MPMPTTRYGRYLFYRARALKRAKRARARHISATSFYTHKTERVYQLDPFVKQKPRKYPKGPVGAVPEAIPPVAGFTVTEAKQHMPPHVIIPWPIGTITQQPTHATRELSAYFRRRSVSLPRLHGVPRNFPPFPKNPLRPDWYFPFDFYPSGAPSYRSTI